MIDTTTKSSLSEELPPGCTVLDMGAMLINVIKWDALHTGWNRGSWDERVDAAWAKFTEITGITRTEYAELVSIREELTALIPPTDWHVNEHASEGWEGERDVFWTTTNPDGAESLSYDTRTDATIDAWRQVLTRAEARAAKAEAFNDHLNS